MHSTLSTCIASLHSEAGDKHHFASPMGLWLLLAVAASVTDANSLERQRVEKALGLPVEQALAVVEELVGDGSTTTALNSALALWLQGDSLADMKAWAQKLRLDARDHVEGEDIYQWRDSLGGYIEHGPIPTNEEGDKWVKENTAGLIEKLPIALDDSTFLVLLSALVTKTTWKSGFHELSNQDHLGGKFKDATKVLVTPEGESGHRVFVEDTEHGLVGVHVATGTNGLAVYSVIADEKVDYLDVIKVAHEIAAQDSRTNKGVPLHHLETQPSNFYSVTPYISSIGDVYTATLPLWKAASEHKDLQKIPALGFGSITESVLVKAGLDIPNQYIETKVQQNVVAEYTKDGFDAAAVTQMSMMIRGVSVPVTKEVKKLNVEFNHPYAVVAVIKDDSSWSETPVFSGWIKEVL